jgi:hypothetical protein
VTHTSPTPQQVLAATYAIVRETRTQLHPPLQKAKRMQELYLSRNVQFYSEEQTAKIQRWFSSVQYRYLSAHIHLEELWTLSMACRWSMLDVLDNAIDKHTWSDDDLLIGSMYLENFLLHARAFLNIYMFYICLLMNIPNPGTMTIDAFQKHMRSVQEPRFAKRAERLSQYFDENVFADGAWGKLLKELRDKITHRENLRPSTDGNEVIAGVLLDWPTIRSMTFERFAQEFSNGAFEMLRTTSPILFELEWKSGAYKEDLWDA